MTDSPDQQTPPAMPTYSPSPGEIAFMERINEAKKGKLIKIRMWTNESGSSHEAHARSITAAVKEIRNYSEFNANWSLEFISENASGVAAFDEPQPAPSPTVVTCVYCGHEYPEGTPTAKHDLLTAHISVCEKHPMREADARIVRLQKALAGLIGVETREQLEAMEVAMRMMPGIDADKITAINAIHALLS